LPLIYNKYRVLTDTNLINALRTLQCNILVLFALVVLSIVTLIHFSMTNIIAEQSRTPQSSLSPTVRIVIQQVIETQQIAEIFIKSEELREIMRLSAVKKLIYF
jgi:hypothetical protein